MRDLVINFQAPINEPSINNLHTLLTSAIDRDVKPLSITILLNSLGGAVHVGIASYNFIQSLPMPITMVNIGNVDSIANIVFLAGVRRLATPEATFHLHSSYRTFNGPQSIAAVEEALSSLRSDNDRMAAIIAKETGFDLNQLREIFLQGRTVSAPEAKAQMMIHDVVPFSMPNNAEVTQVAAVF